MNAKQPGDLARKRVPIWQDIAQDGAGRDIRAAGSPARREVVADRTPPDAQGSFVGRRLGQVKGPRQRAGLASLNHAQRIHVEQPTHGGNLKQRLALGKIDFNH